MHEISLGKLEKSQPRITNYTPKSKEDGVLEIEVNMAVYAVCHTTFRCLELGPNLDRHILDRTKPRQTYPRQDQT